MSSYLDKLPKPFLVLAPMEDVTDTVFRRVIQSIAPFDLYMTEFTNVDGLQSPGREATIKRLRYEASEQPLIAQIWGKTPDNFYKTTLELREMGFVGVDINMGCPVKAVVKNATGGGLIAHPDEALAIIEAVKKAAGPDFPVSVKTRIGTREFEKSWIELLLQQNLNMLTVHLRTVKEQSLVDAHWELMPEIVALRNAISASTAVVGNGDVRDRAHAVSLASEYGMDGAMIGRGVFHDPYASVLEDIWPGVTVADKLGLYLQHVELYKNTWNNDPGKPIAPLNKFCKVYVSGFDGAKELRETLMAAKTVDELESKIEQAIVQV